MEAASRPTSMNRGTVLALVAMGLSVLILANDFTALNVALPSIEKAFDTDVSTIQWVINAYALVFGVLLVTGGRLADMFGRRRVFFIGTTIFMLMSLLAGVAQNEYWLIAARAAMGIGGALMWPAILGMTFAALPKEKAGLAGGIILGAAGIGQAIGPILGGLLTEYLSWRWTLFINIPIGLTAMFVTWREVHQPRPEAGKERIDYAGMATLSIGLLAVLFALDQGVDWGWTDWKVLAALGVAAVLLVSFPFVERRAGESALVPGDVIRNRRFAAACGAILLISATFIAAMLYLPQFLQKILEYSPVRAGLGMLPIMLGFAALSFVAGPLYDRLGAKKVVTSGAFLIAVGALLLSFLNETSGYAALIPGMVVMGIGFGLFYGPATTAGITALDESRSSLAGGIAYMAQIAGGSVGLGLTTSIFTALSDRKLDEQLAQAGAQLTDAQADAAHGILAGTESGLQVQQQFPDIAHELERFVREAFVTGFDWAFRVDSALAFGGAALALAFVGHRFTRGSLPHGTMTRFAALGGAIEARVTGHGVHRRH
jgi:EmrB/QacA subfamily drug resistance transporter